MTSPLQGLKVLDLTWVVAGPVMTRALADFGATVVRLESSTRVETARYMQPFHGGKVSTEGSALYGTWNAGKLGVTVNLRDEKGQQIVRDLAAWADVVLEAFSPGTLSKWGLDYASLSADHPDLIMVSSSINGQTGPFSRLAGFGNVGAALSGFQETSGWPEDVPIGPFGPYTDFVGPRMGLAVLLAALEHRAETGEGCNIDLSQVESGVYFQAPELVEYELTGAVAQRMGNRDRAFAPHGVFRAADETIDAQNKARFVAIAVTTDDQWTQLADWLGDDTLTADTSLDTASGRLAAQDRLEAAIERATCTRIAHEIEIELQARGVPSHVVAASRDFVDDPQIASRGHLVTLDHPLFGTTVVEGPRYLLSDTPGIVENAAPTFGRDNERVLRDILQYDDDRVRDLIESEVMK